MRKRQNKKNFKRSRDRKTRLINSLKAVLLTVIDEHNTLVEIRDALDSNDKKSFPFSMAVRCSTAIILFIETRIMFLQDDPGCTMKWWAHYAELETIKYDYWAYKNVIRGVSPLNVARIADQKFHTGGVIRRPMTKGDVPPVGEDWGKGDDHTVISKVKNGLIIDSCNVSVDVDTIIRKFRESYTGPPILTTAHVAINRLSDQVNQKEYTAGKIDSNGNKDFIDIARR